MSAETRNEAARLHDALAQFGNRDLRIQMIGIALAGERRATVERIRAALLLNEGEPIPEDYAIRILDEEAAR